ncbi:AAA family ATPase [Paenibacillus macerans]|uniref:AAA family ATPase n=1 Tax=Paenibacillus macerans TaxID=44252 RepID=UPI003D314DCD
MIDHIKEINNFGIYHAFSKNATLCCFKQFNLFYGWNGSGKSTLSRLFNILEKKAIPQEFINSDFKIILEDGLVITKNNLVDFSRKIFVFNQEFIGENINWNESLKSLLLISEEKIDEHNCLQKLIQKRQELLHEEQQLRISIDNENKEIDSFLSATAKKIKQHFQVIDTSDRYYFNYNKTKLEGIITNIDHSTKFKVLSEDEVAKITTSINPTSKDTIDLSVSGLSIENYQEAAGRLSKLIKTSVITYSIERLRNNSEINKWVEEGYHLHKNNRSTNCEFCGQNLPKERIQELDNHFSDVYKEFLNKLNNAYSWILLNRIKGELPVTSALYEELKNEYNEGVNEIINITNKINDLLDSWNKIIEQKIKDPFNTNFQEITFDESVFLTYNKSLGKIKKIVESHNNKTNNFKLETDRLKKMLEYHFMLKAIDDFKFISRQTKIRNQQEKKRGIENSIKANNKEVADLESLLSNEVFGASVFNKLIHSFLGHSELSLRFDNRDKGYRIIRNNRLAKNLSEGEKTAIAFVYFIVKLKENGNKISDSIVVIDDPISSFDSNNLFHAYSFLINEFHEAHQLFILTHNFVFYKLLRDWLSFRDRKGKSSFYTIETVHSGDERGSQIKNTNSALLNYNSEYHYVFSRIYDYKNKSDLNLDDAFLVSNLCRKLLESFLSFKFPKKRRSFNQLVSDAISDRTRRERIYRFINKYSHNETIEFEDNTIDNLLAESSNIVVEVLELIKELDLNHYTELENIITEGKIS